MLAKIFKIARGIKGIKFNKDRFKLVMQVYERPESILDLARWLYFVAFSIVLLPFAFLDSLEILYEAN